MSEYYLTQFEEKFKELIETLSNKFPDKLEIKVYNKSLNRLNYTKIAKHYADTLKQYSNLITNSDESLFNNKIEFIDQINFDEIWSSNLSADDKKSLWQYIQILYLLSTLIQSNNNLVNTVPTTKCKTLSKSTDEKLSKSADEKLSKSVDEILSESADEILSTDEILSKSVDNILSADGKTSIKGDTDETIYNLINNMKTNLEDDKIKLDLNNISKDQIDDATNVVKTQFKSNNIMDDMINEINNELTNIVDNKNVEEVGDVQYNNPQIDMMSQMLNLNIDKGGLGNIMNIANKISQKFQSRVENGELNPEDLMKSAQNMLQNMNQSI